MSNIGFVSLLCHHSTLYISLILSTLFIINIKKFSYN